MGFKPHDVWLQCHIGAYHGFFKPSISGLGAIIHLIINLCVFFSFQTFNMGLAAKFSHGTFQKKKTDVKTEYIIFSGFLKTGKLHE